jgi:hypothetical protein
MNRTWYQSVLPVVACVAMVGAAHADDVIISGGTLLNNNGSTGRVAPLVDVTARKSECIKHLDCHIGLTHVFKSDFGQHEHKGSAQFVTAGLAKPWVRGGLEWRAGGGLLAAVHYDWGSHYDEPMTKETYKAECILCGWFAQGSVSRGRLELSLRYTSTDPNFWTSYNGALVMLGYRL